MKRFALLIAALLLGAGVSRLVTAAEELKPGDQAPDFEMVGTDGETYKLSDFADKQAIVIAWYPKAFTGGCTKECESLRDSGEQLREFDVAYFTASCDTPEKNKEFAKSLDLDYTILSDPEGKTAMAYGIYNPERKVANRVTFIIAKDGKILDINRKVAVGEHGIDIAKKLEELKIPKK